MKESLKTKLYEKIRSHIGVIHSEDLVRYAQSLGFKAETGGRALRKLAEDKMIQRHLMGKKHSVAYSALGTPKKPLETTTEPTSPKLEFNNSKQIHDLKWGKK